jgi:hypothetical protein
MGSISVENQEPIMSNENRGSVKIRNSEKKLATDTPLQLATWSRKAVIETGHDEIITRCSMHARQFSNNPVKWTNQGGNNRAVIMFRYLARVKQINRFGSVSEAQI